MALYNSTNTIGLIIEGLTTGSTGDIIVTLILMILLLFAIAILFGIPLEYTSIIVFPVIFSCMIYFNEFMLFGGVMFIYFAIIFTKTWIFR